MVGHKATHRWERKFALKHIDRDDIMALTGEAAYVSYRRVCQGHRNTLSNGCLPGRGNEDSGRLRPQGAPYIKAMGMGRSTLTAAMVGLAMPNQNQTRRAIVGSTPFDEPPLVRL